MATLSSPVELPTGRNSFMEFPMTASIQDPTSWSALTGRNLGSDSPKATTPSDRLAHLPSQRSQAPSRSQQSIRSKASPAIEFPPQELEAPASYFPPRQSSAQAARVDHSTQSPSQVTRSDTGRVTQASDDSSGSGSSTSTAGTTSVLENQVYTLPGSNDVYKEERVTSPALHSAKSTSSMAKKSAVPTSKYKKKSPASIRSSVKRKSGVESPLGSPMSSYTQILQSPTLTAASPAMPTELPAAAELPSLPATPLETQPRQGQAPLQHAKSTASVRKARALHSHPSMPSLRTEDLATSPPIQHSPSLAVAGLRIRKSMDAPRKSLYELQEPSPAPNTPLPDLPPGVAPLSRPASQGVLSQPTPPPDAHVRPGTSSSTVAPILRRQDSAPPIHAEMANFMASSSKIIFRRFHDVHIRLLLTLQDEISGLEKELAEIESVENEIDVDREARRVKILGELRKLLAEYDHLFANWNLMQSSKADAKTREELEQFLKRPGANPSATISTGAVDDLVWLQNHGNDLSCVDLSARKLPTTASQREVIPEKKIEEKTKPSIEVTAVRQTTSGSSGGGGGGVGGGGGGFAALFASCAGKRK